MTHHIPLESDRSLQYNPVLVQSWQTPESCGASMRLMLKPSADSPLVHCCLPPLQSQLLSAQQLMLRAFIGHSAALLENPSEGLQSRLQYMDVLVTEGPKPPIGEYPDRRVVPVEPTPTMDRLRMSLMPWGVPGCSWVLRPGLSLQKELGTEYWHTGALRSEGN